MNSPRHNAGAAPSLAVVPNERATDDQGAFEFPATLGQHRFWLLDRLRPGGSTALNMTLRMRLHGPLEPDLLRNALNQIVNRHEALRTTFAVEHGQLRQIIAPELCIDLPFTEALHLTKGSRADFVEQAACEEAQRPFDLKTGPFVRARLTQLDDLEHLLLVTVHRLVSDEWSNAVLTRELWTVYSALAQRREPSLPKLPLQFADYADWQHARLTENDFDDQRDYWRQQLSGIFPILQLPFDRSRPMSGKGSAASRARAIRPELLNSAKAFATQQKTTPFALFLAVFDLLMWRYTGATDFLVTTPGTNRDRADFDSIVGPLANPILLRAEIRDGSTFAALLGSVSDSTVQAFTNQDVPFELLLDDFQTSQLQLQFRYDSAPSESISLPNGLVVEPLGRVNGGTLHQLSAAVIEDRNGARIEIEYDEALFDIETIARMLNNYEMLLRDLIADPKRAIAPPTLFPPRLEARAATDQAKSVVKGESVRPYLGLQLQLIAIWESVLGVRGIGIRDNFFDLGGNSLLALRMLSRAERICGTAILPSSFADNPDVEHLASEIAREAIDESPNLLKLHESGSRTPFFYLHGDLFGGGLYSLRLSRALGNDQPFFVLPPRDVRALPRVPSIEEMATAHYAPCNSLGHTALTLSVGFVLAELWPTRWLNKFWQAARK